MSVVYTCVVATSKVVGGIFFATDQLFRVKELAISPSPHFINHSGFKINEYCTRDVLSCTGFTEKGVESIITSSNGLVTRHLAIRLDREYRNISNILTIYKNHH